ncbi:DUF2637 domain-containing protein [Streptomyces sp. AV19]|uniref:DUF2637 domain-containing protein n=1 Tax=Streptomyces sp. AV19 TaxID=2793068 RepID=UPI0018FE6700|nr:DUF2637 domain-containing protein [Streptomyces sp. AV19]MBH1934265.1 DUF2637 domain-containing protein [Streptomyces sp. AV19]MDG4533425.1 DUF2637 domain-containing protein [Streptomyces sp. AV19]
MNEHMAFWHEQRRQDRLSEREQDRVDRAERAAQQREARRLEREQDRDDRAAARAEKRQDRADRRTRQRERRAWAVDNGALICTAIVMACAIVPAVASQVIALSTAGLALLLAALLAVMLEGGAWAATFGAAKAARQGRPTGRYRAATWGCAALAAGVNFWHGSRDYGLWLGVVLALASLFAVAMWELHLHGAHAPAGEERERTRHARQRRWHHRKVCRTADRLMTAAPYGTLPTEDAFATAWRVHHGTAPGLTPDLLGARLSAESRLGQVVETAADTGAQRITARLWSADWQPIPIVGPTCPVPAGQQHRASMTVERESAPDRPGSIPALPDSPADRLPGMTLDLALPRSSRPLGARAPRRPPGRLSRSSRRPPAPRTEDELFAQARALTADWPDDALSAEAIRKALRIAPSRARALRDALKAEREAAARLVEPSAA